MILVSAGTGVAPFCGFLLDRLAAQQAGEPFAPALCFFGVRDPAVDYIFRELAIDYLGRNDLAHVTDEDMVTTSISRPEITDDGVARTQGGEKRDVQLILDVDPETEMRQMARERGFTGDICDECGGSQMVRNGTCLKCNACGATTGCS